MKVPNNDDENCAVLFSVSLEAGESCNSTAFAESSSGSYYFIPSYSTLVLRAAIQDVNEKPKRIRPIHTTRYVIFVRKDLNEVHAAFLKNQHLMPHISLVSRFT